MSWPENIIDIKYPCSADDSLQPALLYAPSHVAEKRPLLVGLHTWSNGYSQGGSAVYAKWCVQNDWFFIYPNFRGPNNKPEAMGSECVVADILDAVKYMKDLYSIDTDRIYLVGVSGGGHAALLMAGRSPEVWAGVSAWCGISDIAKWWRQTKDAGLDYCEQIEASCGGSPDDTPEIMQECRNRSPLTYLQNAQSVNLDINAGVKDGRNGSVPFSQSLHAFNAVAQPKDRIKTLEIETYYNDGVLPPNGNQCVSEHLYQKRPPLFTKTSSNSRVVIFDGAHEIVHLAALNWLRQQRRGIKASWLIEKPAFIDVSDRDTQSGM